MDYDVIMILDDCIAAVEGGATHSPFVEAERELDRDLTQEEADYIASWVDMCSNCGWFLPVDELSEYENDTWCSQCLEEIEE